ncbi:YtxH domain-containing protein [Arcobacter sp.]|uniref:YtxH domain-containing protein n=1 Tax=unclassified Arcobacter TaxID=2593671 RepID=UPI003B004D3A
MNNQYDINIESSRPSDIKTTANINQNPYINQNANLMNNPQQQNIEQSQNGFNTGDFVKGALIGAAVTYLLTNKNAQEKAMQVFGKGSELFQAGVEELKEKYEDMKAQMQANNE